MCLKLFPNLHKYTLSKQLLWSLSLTTIGALLIIVASCAIYVGILITDVKTDSTNDSINQALTDMKNIAKDGVSIFDINIEKAGQNYINILTNSAEDVYRSDYPFDYLPSYYNTESMMAPPVFFDTRYNTKISLTASSYNVYNKTVTEISNIPALVNTLDKTASLDSTFKSLYATYPLFIACYVAINDWGFVREYPGQTDENIANLLKYDPRNEDWYIKSVAQKNKIIYSEPYYDKYVKQYMITLSRSFNNIETNEFMGVVGSDMSILSIESLIKDIKYSHNSRVLLFDIPSDGLVIIDNSNVVKTGASYSDVRNPSISDDNWNIIKTKEFASLNIDSYYIEIVQSKTKNYVFLIIVPENVITENTKHIKDDSYNITLIISLIICLCTPVIMCIVPCLIRWRTKPMVKQFEDLSSDMTTIAKNLGSDNITNGIVLSQSSSSIDETDKLRQGLDSLVKKIGEKKEVKYFSNNPYYNKPTPWTLVPASVVIPGSHILVHSQPVYVMQHTPGVYSGHLPGTVEHPPPFDYEPGEEKKEARG